MRLGLRGRLFLAALGWLAMATGGAALLAVAVQRGALGVWAACLLGLGLAVGFAAAAAWLGARDLRRLAATAEAMAGSALGRQAPVAQADERAVLAAALERLAAGLQSAGADLRGERDRFGAVLEGMTEGVVALAADGTIVLCNRPAAAMLGGTESPLGRRLVTLLRQPELQELLARKAKEPATAPGATPAEAELKLSDGRVLRAEATRPGTAGIATLVVLRDVTALRRLEKVRQDFVANVSHELRTPVATVAATAETLLDGALEDPQAAREFAETILRHARRLTRILDDLLDLSRVEAGAYQLESGPVALAERVQHAAALLEPALRARRQTLRLDLQGPTVARGAAGALDQVLFNLLDNASKYTPEGAEIQVSTALGGGGRIALRIADNGPGIPLHQRERVFERFYRIDAGRSRDRGGSGLGLAIVKHLVEAMGGRVGVEANRPQGAVFWVELPVWPGPGGGA